MYLYLGQVFVYIVLKIILSVPVFIVLYLQNPKLRDFVAKEYFEKAVKKTSNEEVNRVGI